MRISTSIKSADHHYTGFRRILDWSLRRPGKVLQPHVLGDDHLHDLAGAAVDAVDPVVRVQPGDRVLVDVAVAAVQLQAPVDDAGGDLGAEQLGRRGVGGGQLAGVVRLQGAVDDGLGRVDLGLAGGQLELGVLERGDRLAEDRAVLGVLRRRTRTAALAWA